MPVVMYCVRDSSLCVALGRVQVCSTRCDGICRVSGMPGALLVEYVGPWAQQGLPTLEMFSPGF